jgi:hypothetical protein
VRHWRVEINFEAWDEADASRMVERILRPVDEERRLLFAGNVEETRVMHTGIDSEPPGEVTERRLGSP